MDLKFFMLDPDTFRAHFARSGPRYKNPVFLGFSESNEIFTKFSDF